MGSEGTKVYYDNHQRGLTQFVKDKAHDFLLLTKLLEHYNLDNGEVIIKISSGGVNEVEIKPKHKRIIFR